MNQNWGRAAHRQLILRFLADLVLVLLACVPYVALMVLFSQNNSHSTFTWLLVLTLFVSPFLMVWLGRTVTDLARSLLDLLDGPQMMMGYVTFRDAEERNSGKYRFSLNIVPAEHFDRWRGNRIEQPRPTLYEDASYLHILDNGEVEMPPKAGAIAPSTGSSLYQLPDVLSFAPPVWAFEQMRLGDLVKVAYSRHNKLIFDVEVVITISLNDKYKYKEDV